MKNPKYDLITIGSGLVDNLIYTGTKENNNKICFPVGEKIRINKMEFNTGGGGTNTAVCASLLGTKTAFMGKLGKGNNANIILRELKKKNIDFIGARGNTHTGYSAILETSKNHRTILTFKGASDTLKFSELKKPNISTKWLHMTSMKGKSFKTQQKLVKYAKKHGIKISYNPSSYQIKSEYTKTKSMLENVDILSLNLEEAKLLSKKQNLKEIHKKLHSLGPKIISITNGGAEGSLSNGMHIFKYKPKKVKVKECTGAGDTFAASLISGIIKNKTLKNSIRIALINTASLIRKEGAKKGLLRWKDITKKLNSTKQKIKKETLR